MLYKDLQLYRKSYLQTYKNKNSYYSKRVIRSRTDFLTSLGKEGISQGRDFEQKKTVLSNTADSYSKETLDTILERITSLIRAYKAIRGDRKREDLYEEFKIKKSSGGFRQLLGPEDDLKEIQGKLIDVFRMDLGVLEHNAAHAYVKNRSIKTNATVHKENYNFVNIDLSDFFTSIGKDQIIEALYSNKRTNMLLSELVEKDMIDDLLDIVLYDGYLPQGSVASPFLSNLVMVSFDYYITKTLKEKHRDIVYTRYADDMTFSSKLPIKQTVILDLIEDVAKEAYYKFNFIKVNPKKTRTTTYRGKNRVTGVKINADNKLSIGWREKQALKSDMVSLIVNKKKGVQLEKEVVEKTIGMFSYLQSIEPMYARHLLRTWSVKFGISNIYKYLLNN